MDESCILDNQVPKHEYNSVSKTTEQAFRLPFLQASFFATVIEETIEKLRILSECNNQLCVMKTKANMDSYLLDKFGVVRPEMTDDLADIDANNLNSDKYKLEKLQSDRDYCIDLLSVTYLNLATKNSYATLYNANVFRIIQGERTNCLLDEEANNKTIRRGLMRNIRHQRNRFKSVLYDTDLSIARLRSHLEDQAVISEVRSRYIDNWQIARSEQNTLDIAVKETGPSENIKYYRNRLEHEIRVHAEVELLTNISITETFSKVEQWMEKFDKNMEEIELDIQKMKTEYETQSKKKVELENTLEKHAREMKEWIHFKDEREKARQYVVKMTNAAVAVQSWWRGLLVRLQMGPFKPVKKRTGLPMVEKRKKK